ncbi:Protein RseC [Saliniradius amylolyticus]|uniref:Protein RseC n=1 Tax=Saliniradius amylolyticus TaxID=2183582 RepID=A0A2S2E1C8_9ALTE|nr:SoxR reducing system RseC family protein [Saliniradius amylolyticus]AWL11399.1 Protein RseC [Saliniradius amylolyticus]
MIEEVGTITEVKDGYIWVKTQIKTTCGGCAANDDCGTGSIAKALSPRAQTLVFAWDEAAHIGQQVKLGIPEQSLLGASVLMYLFPLLTLIAAALLADWALPRLGLNGELWVVLSSFAATAACFYWLRGCFKDSRRAQRFQPQLLCLLPWHGRRLSVQQLEP